MNKEKPWFWRREVNKQIAQKKAATSESKNPAPVDMVNIHYLYTSQVVSRISSINRIYWQEPCGSSRLKRLPTYPHMKPTNKALADVL